MISHLRGHATGPLDLEPADRSLQIHACHGRTRQVEVLRDAILHRLEADPSLEPRDVIVMSSFDIETFAPLIQAAFGVDASVAGPGSEPIPAAEAPAGNGLAGDGLAGDGPAGDGPALRVRLADRSLRQTNPLLAVAADLLELAGSRVTAPQVVDLAARPPVSRRFRFDQDELSTIERWIAGTAVRALGSRRGLHRRPPWSLAGTSTPTPGTAASTG